MAKPNKNTKIADSLKKAKAARKSPDFQRHYEAVKDTATHYMPFTANTITNFNRTINEINNWVKTSTPFRKNPQGTAEEKKIYRFAASMFDAAKADLKEGNLLTFKNLNAKLGELVGGMGDQDFDEEYDAEYDDTNESYSSSSFGGFDAEMYMEGTAISTQATIDAVSSATDIISNTQLEAADYTSKRVVAGTNIAISHVLKYQAANADILNAINSNISTLVETVNRQDAFQSEATRFYDSTTSKLDEMIELMKISADPAQHRREKREAREFKRLQEEDFLENGFDPGKFAKQIWNKSSLGMIGQMSLATIEPFLGLIGFDVSKLTGSYSGMGVGTFRPVQMLFEKSPLYRTLKDLTEQNQNIWEAMFHRLTADAKNFSNDPMINDVIGMLSQFGILDRRLVKPKGISLGSYDKEAQLPTGMTLKAIEVVIPKYLSSIENSMATLVEGFTTGQFTVGTFETSRLSKLSEEEREANFSYFQELLSGNLKNIYDFNEATFKKAADIRNEYKDEYNYMLQSAMSRPIDNITASISIRDPEEIEKFNKELSKILTDIGNDRNLSTKGSIGNDNRSKFRKLLINNIDMSKFDNRESAHSAIDRLLEQVMFAGADYQRAKTEFHKNINKGGSKYENLLNAEESMYVSDKLSEVNERRSTNKFYDTYKYRERYAIGDHPQEYMSRSMKGKFKHVRDDGKEVNYYNFNRNAKDNFKEFYNRLKEQHNRNPEDVTQEQLRDAEELMNAFLAINNASMDNSTTETQADPAKRKEYEKIKKRYVKQYGSAPTDYFDTFFNERYSRTGQLKDISLPRKVLDAINLPVGRIFQDYINFARNMMVYGEIEDTWKDIGDFNEWTSDQDSGSDGSGGSGGKGGSGGGRGPSLKQAFQDSLDQLRDSAADVGKAINESIRNAKDKAVNAANTFGDRARMIINEGQDRFFGSYSPKAPTSSEQNEQQATDEAVNSASLDESYDASADQSGLRDKDFETEGATTLGTEDQENSPEKPMKAKGLNDKDYTNDKVNKAKTWTDQFKALMIEISSNLRRMTGASEDSHIRLFGPGGIFSDTIVKFMENFKTVETFLFGEKDENGYYKGGLIAPSTANKLVDAKKAAKNYAFGEEYTDYAGNKHEAKEDYLLKGVKENIDETKKNFWINIAGEDYRNSKIYNSSIGNLLRHAEDRDIKVRENGEHSVDENGIAKDNYKYNPNPLPGSKVRIIGWVWNSDENIWQFRYDYGDKKNQFIYPDPKEFDWEYLKDPGKLPQLLMTEVLVNELNRLTPPEVKKALQEESKDDDSAPKEVSPEESTGPAGKQLRELFGYDFRSDHIEEDTKRNLAASVFLNGGYLNDNKRDLYNKKETTDLFDQLMNGDLTEEQTRDLISKFLLGGNGDVSQASQDRKNQVEAATQRILSLRDKISQTNVANMDQSQAVFFTVEIANNMRTYYYEKDVNGSPVMYKGYLNSDGNAIANSASPMENLTFFNRTISGNKIEDLFLNNETGRFEKYISNDGGKSFVPAKDQPSEEEKESNIKRPENIKSVKYSDLVGDEDVSYSVTNVNGKAVLSGHYTDADGQKYLVDMEGLERIKTANIKHDGKVAQMQIFGKYLMNNGQYALDSNNNKILDNSSIVNASFAKNKDGSLGDFIGEDLGGIHSPEDLQKAIDKRMAVETEANDEVTKQTESFLSRIKKRAQGVSTVFFATLGLVMGGPVGLAVGAGFGSGKWIKPLSNLNKTLFGKYSDRNPNTLVGKAIDVVATAPQRLANLAATIFTTTIGFTIGGPVGAGIGFALGAGSFKKGGVMAEILGGRRENGSTTKGIAGGLFGGALRLLFGTRVKVDDPETGKSKTKRTKGLVTTVLGAGLDAGKFVNSKTQDSGAVAPILGSLLGLSILGIPGLLPGYLGGKVIGQAGNTVSQKIGKNVGNGEGEYNSASYQDYDNESEGYGVPKVTKPSPLSNLKTFISNSLNIPGEEDKPCDPVVNQVIGSDEFADATVAMGTLPDTIENGQTAIESGIDTQTTKLSDALHSEFISATGKIIKFLRDQKSEDKKAILVGVKKKKEQNESAFATGLSTSEDKPEAEPIEAGDNIIPQSPENVAAESQPSSLNKMSTLASDLNKGMANTASGIKGLVNGFTDFISFGLGAAASLIFGPEVGPIVQVIAKSAGRAATTAIPILGGIVIGGSFIAKFFDTPIGKQLKENVDKFFGKVKTWWVETGEPWVHDRLEDINDTIKKYWPVVQDWLTNAAVTVTNTVVDFITAIDWMAIGKAVADSVVAAVKSAFNPFDKNGNRKTNVVDMVAGNSYTTREDPVTGETITVKKQSKSIFDTWDGRAVGLLNSLANPLVGIPTMGVHDVSNAISNVIDTLGGVETVSYDEYDKKREEAKTKKKQDLYENKSEEDLALENEGNGSVGYGRLNGPHYSQLDKQWKNVSFGTMNNGKGTTIGTGGCGPTALATVARSITGNRTITPSTVANMAQDYGYTANGGSNANLFTEGANRLGLSSRRIRTRDIAPTLASGKSIIVSGRKKGPNSPYTNAGHIIAIRGIQNGKAVVDDPLKNSTETMSIGNVLQGAKKAWAIGSGNVGYGYNPNYSDRESMGYGWLYNGSMPYDVPLTYKDNPDLVLANPYNIKSGQVAMYYLQYPFDDIYSTKKSEKLWKDKKIDWTSKGGTFYGGCIPTAFANIVSSVSGVDVDPLTLTRLYGFPSLYNWEKYGDMYYLLTGKGSPKGDPAAWASNIYTPEGYYSTEENSGNNPAAIDMKYRTKEEAKQYNAEIYQKMIDTLSSGGGVFIDTHSAPKIANGHDYSSDGHGFALYGWNKDSQTFYTLDPGRSNPSYQVTEHTLSELYDDIMNGRIRNAEGFPKGDEHVRDRLQRRMRDFVARYFPSLFVNGQVTSTKTGLPYSGYEGSELKTFVTDAEGLTNVGLNPTGARDATSTSTSSSTSEINYNTDSVSQNTGGMTANDYGGYKYAEQLDLGDTTLFGKIGNMMTILAGIAGNIFKSIGGDPYESVFGVHSSGGSASGYNYSVSGSNYYGAGSNHVPSYIKIPNLITNEGYSYIDVGDLDLSDDEVLGKVAEDVVKQLIQNSYQGTTKTFDSSKYSTYIDQYKAYLRNAYNNKEFVDGKYYKFTMPGAEDSILIPAWYHKDNVIHILGQQYPYSAYEEYMKGRGEEANQKKYQDFLEESYDKYALGIARNANGTQNIGMSLYTYDGKPASSKASADIAAEISGSGSDLIVPTIIASQYGDAYNTPISSDMGFDVVVPNGLPAQYANTGLPTSAVSEKNPSWSAEPSYKFRGDTARSMLQNSYGITNISNNPKDYAAEEPISAGIFIKNTNCGTQPPGTLFRDFRKFPPITADKMNQLIDDISSKGTPLKGMGQDFVDASNMSGIDPRVLVAWAQAESGSGTHAGISTKKGNLYGIGAEFGNAQNGAWNFASPDGTINWRSAVLRQAEYLSRNWVNRHDGSFDPLACPALLGWSSWHKYGTGYDFDGETPPAEGSAMYMTSYGNSLANIVKRTEGYGEAEGYGDLDMSGLANMANMKDDFDITDNPMMNRMIGSEGFGRINTNNNNTHRTALSIHESREYAPVIKSDNHASTHISVDNPVDLGKIESGTFKMVSLLEEIVHNTASRGPSTTINNHIHEAPDSRSSVGYGQGNVGKIRDKTVAVTDPKINNNYHDKMHQIHDLVARTPRATRK